VSGARRHPLVPLELPPSHRLPAALQPGGFSLLESPVRFAHVVLRCAAIFEGGWGAANWSFSLRYNHSEVPLTKRNIDKFTPGLSTKFAMYYSSGFLSLQTAISDAIVRALMHPFSRLLCAPPPSPCLTMPARDCCPQIRHELGGADDLGLFVYASPFPVPEYSNNRFLDHAGPLVGLVIVLSFLIPLATMLRALVLEKESKLREGLLMSGLSLPAYYQSIVITYGGTFVLVALLAAFIITPNLFPLSSFFLVLLLFVLFALAVLAYTCAISSFFSNARVAAILGPLSLFLSTQIIFIFLDRQTGVLEEGMAGAKTIASLLPAMGFYLGVSRLSLYEGAEQAVTMQNLFEGEFSYGSSLVLLAFDIVLWSALAWYLDQVVPSEYGLQKPWYFCCLPSHWCGSSTSGVGDEHVSASLLQPLGGEGALPPPLVIEDDAEPVRGMGVRTQGLRKKFYSGPNDGVAVAGLDLRMNPGQITSLLGANGAGKTTTVSMLTGLIQPSGGNASIDGLSVRTGMRQIRRSLGVCPQQNVIFLPLTPVDHLILHGELKGLRGIELDQQMREILNHVGLVERAYVPAAALSGGQKRKLCLAIALIGSPATCFLDEPTSGMDPHSRRSIWALLRTKREGRTIVLTTHFLDEAEILSDRIAIMAEGSLRCVGSPLFLKARLGCGYRLTVSKVVGEFASEKLLTLLRKHEPDAEIMVDERFYSEVKLPSGNIGGFSALFSELDTSLSALGVTEYGLTCTTLEDVFLRINEKNLERLDQLRTTQVEAPSTPAEGVSAAPANGGRSCCTPSGPWRPRPRCPRR
jgi:ATP-binding cassette subfamily A (ABC1) protein 3